MTSNKSSDSKKIDLKNTESKKDEELKKDESVKTAESKNAAAEKKISKSKQNSNESAKSEGNSSWANFKRTGRLRLYTRRFFRRPSAVFGLVILVILVFFALFGSLFTKYSYTDTSMSALREPPSADHWLGTTKEGSDMYAMLIRGLGRSLAIGIISSICITIIAAIVGTAIAYFEGWFEHVGMWFLDMLLIVPSFLLISLLIGNASGGSDWLWLTFGLSVFGWIGYARTIRTLTLSLREREYVRAAKFEGVNSFFIIIRHLVPNLGSVLIINLVLGVIGAINGETALSFLGIGIKSPDTSLGVLLSTGQDQLYTAPWLILPPAVVLVLLTFSMQLIGDGLRDAIDPYSKSVGKAE